MNSKQKSVVVIALITVFGMVLLPPWKSRSYALIFDPPSNTEIDVVRLILQCILTVVFAAAMFITFNKKEEQSDGSEAVARTDKMPLYVVSGFVAIGLTIFGWHSANQYLAQQAVREAAVAEEHQAMATASRMVDSQDRSAALASALRQQEEKVEGQAAKERDSRLKKLASVRRWPPVSNLMPGIKASLFTHWQDGSLYYQFKVAGSPADLEFAASPNHRFQVGLIDASGIELFRFDIEPNRLKPYSNRSGAWSSMATDLATISCPVETYEKLVKWRLQYSHE
jgi:hypothetical protein